MSTFTTRSPAPLVVAVAVAITGAVPFVGSTPAYAVPAVPLAPPCISWVNPTENR
jgi:hypothetical protein